MIKINTLKYAKVLLRPNRLDSRDDRKVPRKQPNTTPDDNQLSSNNVIGLGNGLIVESLLFNLGRTGEVHE